MTYTVSSGTLNPTQLNLHGVCMKAICPVINLAPAEVISVTDIFSVTVKVNGNVCVYVQVRAFDWGNA